MKVFIPLICYNHMCHTSYMMSILRLVLYLRGQGVDLTIYPITFDSLISRARNAAVAHFLSDASSTHILFIDADIEFNAEDVYKLILADKDVIGGAYAQKWLDEARLKDGKPIELSTRTSCHLVSNKVESIMECEYITTGFLLIKRGVFERLAELHPERRYKNDIDGYVGAKDCFYDFFMTRVNPVSRRYESEDYGFSRLWRESGGRIYVLPDITLKHHGWFAYPANLHRQLSDLNLVK